MKSKLQELTQKIYQDGIEKAKSEEKALVDNAKKEAAQILADAKKEAEALIANAKKENELLQQKTNAEIKVAGEQAMSLLKQEMVAILAKNTISADVCEVVKSKELIADVVKIVAAKMGSEEMNLNLILPEKSQKEFEAFFKKEMASFLNKGMELKFENRMSGGFKIAPKDGSYVLSFTEDDFVNFFQSFLRPKAKKILFPGA